MTEQDELHQAATEAKLRQERAKVATLREAMVMLHTLQRDNYTRRLIQNVLNETR